MQIIPAELPTDRDNVRMATYEESMLIRQEETLIQIELDRLRWLNTGNPLYVWRAIEMCFSLGALQHESATHKKPVAPPCLAPYLPAWCLDYLCLVSTRMSRLRHRQDFRKVPKPIGRQEPTKANWNAAEDLKQDLSPVEAAKLTANALGIVRGTINSFERFSTLFLMELDEFSMECLRSEGNSRSKAMSILLEESGLQDAETMRRRIKLARQSLQEPAPANGPASPAVGLPQQKKPRTARQAKHTP